MPRFKSSFNTLSACMCRLWPWAHLNSCRPTEASGGNAAFFILFLWFTDFKCWINLLIQRMWASTKPRPERRPLTENCDTDVFSNIVTKHKVIIFITCSVSSWSCVWPLWFDTQSPHRHLFLQIWHLFIYFICVEIRCVRQSGAWLTETSSRWKPVL